MTQSFFVSLRLCDSVSLCLCAFATLCLYVIRKSLVQCS